MKKTFSILLTILMAFSVMSVAASAIETEYEIRVDETITVSAPNFDTGEFCYIKFVPETDGKFVIKSYAGEDIDPFCDIYDADMAFRTSNDDLNGLNFCLEYDFIAGETYYFAVAVYSQEAEFEVSLVCGHTYKDGICTVCENVCDHSEIDYFGYCPCEKVFLGIDLTDGDELEHDAAAFNNESQWYRFVPEESGAFCFESFTDPDVFGDSDCELYAENGESLHSSYYKDESDNFKLVYNFEEGKTYYFDVRYYAEDTVFTLKFNRAVHTTDDGSVHYAEYVEKTESDCMKHGYNEGLYCPDCDEYIWGHEEREISEIHPDFDWDDICDDCGTNLADDETPTNFFQYIISLFMNFFNRIISFFVSLFK